MTNDPLNLFDSQICVDCGLPCHFGSGRFINRYSVYNDDVGDWEYSSTEEIDEEDFEEKNYTCNWEDKDD